MFWNQSNDQQTTKKIIEADHVINSFGGDNIPIRFEKWCVKELAKISNNHDNTTFAHYIIYLDSPNSVRDYIKEYLGDNKEINHFADEFLSKKAYYLPNSTREVNPVTKPKKKQRERAWSTVGNSNGKKRNNKNKSKRAN